MWPETNNKDKDKKEKKMKKYECEYKGKVRQYNAATAIEAMGTLCRRNKVEQYLVGCDKETMGIQYARAWVYQAGEKSNGEWVDMRVVNEMKEVA